MVKIEPEKDWRMRYSGDVTISILLISDHHYVCRVSTEDGDEWRTVVNPPQHSAYAIDSEEAFDHVARAGVAFIDAEGACLPVAYTDEAVFISRDEENPWPKQ